MSCLVVHVYFCAYTFILHVCRFIEFIKRNKTKEDYSVPMGNQISQMHLAIQQQGSVQVKMVKRK